MPPNLHNQRRENSGTNTCNPASRTLPMCSGATFHMAGQLYSLSKLEPALRPFLFSL